MSRGGSSDTSLEPAGRAAQNAIFPTGPALSKPEIYGFQFCISYTWREIDRYHDFIEQLP